MKYLYITVFILIFISIYASFLEVFSLSKRTSVKALKFFRNKKNKGNDKLVEKISNYIANKIIRFISMEDEDKERLRRKLRTARIRCSPEKFIALIYSKIILVNFLALLFYFISPLISLILFSASILLYFEKLKEPDKIIKDSREKIEKELPRLTNQISEEIKNHSDIILMLSKYLNNAGEDFKRELNITIADLKSGNSELALQRLDSRIASPMMSEIIRGLIALKRGDDVRSYFSNLSYNFRKEEIARLRKEALKIPQKIKKYSFMVAMLFVFLYMIALAGDILSSFSEIF